jgi:glycosyltransferase involved in cell wall biosynthesis/SAM-dependent methyltransferase
MRAFTIVGRNYLAHARVLARSLAVSNPDVEFDVFILDDDGTVIEAEEPFGVLRPEDVFERQEFDTLLSIYSVMELATAVKPRVLRHLLDHSDGPAAYLDPDLWFFDSLAHVADLATEHGIVLTPHAVSPMHRDGRRPAETEILKSGVYNLGFITVGQDARPFLDWWWERLERDCIVAPEDGYFVDQRWVDFAPGMFDHYILRDPGYNVAYWNLGERSLRWTGQRYEVDDRPLVFAHFSGFDPTDPYVLSKHAVPTQRVLLSEQPDLARICNEYAEAMLEAGYVEAKSVSFGLDTLPNGMRIDRHMRRLYREALLEFEDPNGTSREPPPNPFAEPEPFFEWLEEPYGKGHPDAITRYLFGLWADRSDLRNVFGNIDGENAAAYLEWVADYGRFEERIPQRLVPTQQDIRAIGERRDQNGVEPDIGVNVAGYLKAELGIGEAARKMAETVEVMGEALSMIAYSGTPSRQEHPIGGVLTAGVDDPPYDINIVTINADSTVRFAYDVGGRFFDRRYTIGMWAWEVEEFPEAWLPAFDLVDEVWMNSQYAADAVRKVATKPVQNFPLTVSVPSSEPMPKAELGLPERFLFLFSFDFFSVFERKNPIALVEAFKLAFDAGEGPILLIKSINGQEKLPDLERLRMAAAEHPDIYLIDGYLPVNVKNRLMATCDAYVSLHRSEGFGITMAEAMALGKPTIATGYSGNLEFMDDDNSYLVDYELTTVPKGCEPYPEGAAWAEPNIEHAARQMRRVFDNPDEAAAMGAEAKRTIERDHSPQARARLLEGHLSRIRATKDQWGTRQGARIGGSGGGTPSAWSQASDAVAWPLENRWLDDDSRGLSDKMRSAAFSAVRPALARERAIDEKILAAIAELRGEVQGVEDSIRRALSMLAVERDRIGQLEDETRHLRSVDRSIESAIGQVGDEIRTVAERQDERFGVVESTAEAAAEGAADFRRDAESHLASLSDQVGALQQWSKATEADLHARPYMSDPAVFEGPDGSMAFDRGEPGDPYRDFEDVFRGHEAFIRERQRVYLPLLAPEGPVLDAGSGRGEMLDLLAQEGIEGIGVDLDRGMVKRCEAKGHDVVLGDVIAYLRDIEDGHFGTIFSAQFIEHVPLDGLVEFLELSVRKLRPGGIFIAETVNPHSLPAFRTFWTDLTHRAPIYPEVALSLVRSAGFARGSIVFPNGTGDHGADLRSQGEYAVVASVSNEVGIGVPKSN